MPLLAADEVEGQVLVLEPRRLAARATAARLSELATECSGVGDLVGLTIRGERKHSARTRIEVVTEAILTARLQRDPELPGVGAIIFDEFHERNLHSDLGLAMCLEVRSTIRPELALVVMSATLDALPAAQLLDTDNVIEVPGRTFPVETVHLSRPTDAGWTAAVADAARLAGREVTGDVLVFVPGRREIDHVSRALRGDGREVLGLHGGSSNDVQQAVLRRSDTARTIVATSVAETSVTLPGIEAVVDGGRLRRARFDPVSGLGRLETVNVTRFAADQRRGRAGRVGPGRCYRLWSTEDHRHLDDAVPPEIADGDPLPVAFELARWGDSDATSLPLLDHPGADRLAAGRGILEQLGLVTPDGTLTARGQAASQLGVHPRVGQLLITATEVGQLDYALPVAAILDSDSWPAAPDLEAEIDRRRNELGRGMSRLRRRLEKLRLPAAPAPSSGTSTADVAELLARAWPDRIAASRPTRDGHFLLASGREVRLTGDSSLSGADFLVVAEADGDLRAATIRRAVSLDRATLLNAAADHIQRLDHVEWNDRNDDILSERQQRLGSIVLHRETLAKPDPVAVEKALQVGLRRTGLDLLVWSDTALSLRHRLAWLHHADPSRWPAMTDEALLDRLDEWLDLSQCRTPAQVRKLGVGRRLLDLLGWEERAALDELAPTSLPVPGGGERGIDYSSGRPVWPVRIQHLFGLDQHPTLGPQQQPVTIELLSPANRPAQVTTDLPGFWRGSYANVRADLRGRYPKHPWPERPWEYER